MLVVFLAEFPNRIALLGMHVMSLVVSEDLAALVAHERSLAPA